jgi:membrane protease YdiL (CAAX protease family)
MQQSKTRRLAFPVFSASFIFSWIVWGALLILTRTYVIEPGSGGFMALFVLGGLGPTIMPLILIWRLLDAQQARSLLKGRLFNFRINKRYYLLAVLLTSGFFAVHFLSTYVIAGGYVRYTGLAPWYQILILFPVMIIGGGLEEVGWRGIGVPELFERLKPLRAMILIGVVWMAWHLPLFFIPGTGQFGTDFISFAAMGFAFSLILAPMMYFSGSAVPCIIAHALFNAYYGMGWLYPISGFNEKRINDLVLLAVGIGVCSIWFTLESRARVHK